MSNYYETLGIAKGASADEIKSSYRKLALKYHPDRNAGDAKAEEKFKEISEAYAVLSDPKKKAQYDQFGSSGFHQRYSTEDIFQGTDFSQIFNEFGFQGDIGDIFGNIFGGGGFGGMHGGQRAQYQARPRKGRDVEYPITIGFMDAYKGSERQINIQLNDGSSRSLKVKIPAGTKTGAKLRIPERGAASNSGGTPGDLFIKISVADHPEYKRVGDDIETPIHLKLSEMFLGSSLEVETPEGIKKLKVPAGISPGQKIRLKGLGFPRGGTRGDLFAVVKLEVPEKLSHEQKESIERLRDVGL